MDQTENNRPLEIKHMHRKKTNLPNVQLRQIPNHVTSPPLKEHQKKTKPQTSNIAKKITNQKVTTNIHEIQRQKND